jgi:hypothetical protein
MRQVNCVLNQAQGNINLRWNSGQRHPRFTGLDCTDNGPCSTLLSDFESGMLLDTTINGSVIEEERMSSKFDTSRIPFTY